MRKARFDVIDLDGTGFRSVTTSLPAAETPCGNPAKVDVRPLGWLSNDVVLFYRFVCGAGTTYYSVDRQGQHLTTLDDNAHQAYASPDGTRIAFADDGNVEVMNADGSMRHVVSEGAYLPDGLRLRRNPWSPDGSRLYVYRADGHYAIDVDGGSNVKLSDLSGLGFNGWSPQGDRLLFTLYQQAKRVIYVVNADGTGSTTLTNSESQNYDAAWARDGRHANAGKGATGHSAGLPRGGGSAHACRTPTGGAATQRRHDPRDGRGAGLVPLAKRRRGDPAAHRHRALSRPRAAALRAHAGAGGAITPRPAPPAVRAAASIGAPGNAAAPARCPGPSTHQL